MSGTNGELGIAVPGLTPGLPATVKVKVSYMKDVVGLSVRDSTDGVQLGSTAVTHNDWWGVTFVPLQGTAVVKVGIFPYLPKSATLLRVDSVKWEQQVGVDYRTQLVRIGTKVNDRYEFGYNGQMKTNEVAGLGNHLYFKFREYDSRIGRFWSVDPLSRQYPWNSNYAFAENRVIDGIDLEGLEWHSKKTGNTVNWIVKLQVINNTTLIDGKRVINEKNMNTYLNAYEKNTERVFSGNFGKTQYKLDIQFVNTEQPFKLFFEDDNTPNIAGDGNAGHVEEIGNTQRNGIHMSVGSIDHEGKMVLNEHDNLEFSWKTFAGELGHTGGLMHPWTDCKDQIPQAPKDSDDGKMEDNLMSHREGTELKDYQVNRIQERVIEQQDRPENAKGYDCK